MKTPSFAGLKAASQPASLAKRMNRAFDTAHENLLRRTLWRRGLRFRKNVTTLPGKPDIVFSRARVAVFCDGDFWHGRNWRHLFAKLRKGANADYWRAKIRSNMTRDRRTTRLLRSEGWRVIRLWEGNIKTNPELAASKIERIVFARLKS